MFSLGVGRHYWCETQHWFWIGIFGVGAVHALGWLDCGNDFRPSALWSAELGLLGIVVRCFRYSVSDYLLDSTNLDFDLKDHSFIEIPLVPQRRKGNFLSLFEAFTTGSRSGCPPRPKGRLAR